VLVFLGSFALVVYFVWMHDSFDAHYHISVTAEARVAKFYTQVEYINC